MSADRVPDLLAKAVNDRDARPWRYYKLDANTLKKFCEQLADKLDAAAEALRQSQEARYTRCECGVPSGVAHYCSSLRHAWLPPRGTAPDGREGGMSKPRVWNKREQYPASAVYVGRPSKWGNPFVIGRDGTREEVIALYASWLISERSDLYFAAKTELRGKDLVCWCAPQPCHADVLLQIANE